MAQLYVQAYSKDVSGDLRRYVELPVGLSTSPGAAPVGPVIKEETGGSHTVTFTLTNIAIPVSDDGVAGGHAAMQLYTFPKGLTKINGGKVSLTLTGGAGLTATSAVVGAVGTSTVGTNDATLTLTEADIIPSTACTLTGSAGAFSAVTVTAPALFDGRTTAKTAHLNFATPDAGVTAATTLTVNGTITISYMVI